MQSPKNMRLPEKIHRKKFGAITPTSGLGIGFTFSLIFWIYLFK